MADHVTARRRALLACISVPLIAVLTACGSPVSTFGVQLQQPPSAALFPATKYTFTTIDNPSDPSFNQILGLNNEGRLGGYYGSGAVGHPNRGYIVYPPYHQLNFKNVNFPSAMDTQVTCLNNKKFVGGFYVDSNGSTSGFIDWLGIWFSYADPQARTKNPVTEILGLNDAGTAVGFYVASPNRYVAFTLDPQTGVFRDLHVPGVKGAVATGISGRGHITGYERTQSNAIIGFVEEQGTFGTFSYPRSKETRAFGITTFDRIVGSYVDGRGTHGFVSMDPQKIHKAVWQPINYPFSKSTVVTGINIHGMLSGYYVKKDGTTHGFIATPGQ
jgi:hypothetical protein